MNKLVEDKALIQKYKKEIEELKTKLNTATQQVEFHKLHESKSSRNSDSSTDSGLDDLQMSRTALKERIDHLTKLILTPTAMSNKVYQVKCQIKNRNPGQCQCT